MTEPAHLVWARSKLGLHAIPGPADNPEIVSWFKFTSLDKAQWHDSTAWCSVFCNAAFGMTGGKGSGSAAAISWAKWGHEVDWEDAQPGDVTVFEWDDGSHHVALFISQAGDFVTCLGGNQLDRPTGYHEVSIKTFRKDDVINLRRT